MQRHLCFINRARRGGRGVTLLEKSFPIKVHHRGYIVLTLIVITDYNVCYITDSYSNIPVDLHKTVENSKKLI